MRPAFSKVSTIWWTGWSDNLEMATDVGFCRGPIEDPAIGVNEGQVLALDA